MGLPDQGFSRSPLGLIKWFLEDGNCTARLTKQFRAAHVLVTSLLPLQAPWIPPSLVLATGQQAYQSLHTWTSLFSTSLKGWGTSFFQVEADPVCRKACQYLKEQFWGRTVIGKWRQWYYIYIVSYLLFLVFQEVWYPWCQIHSLAVS